ncbi:hypothetical protein HOLleu_36635 [Holothuria leucospilota]|uniref:Uncharacterized protein n=1 Tax=Holothuria leucospilota TaxID=206669 RepID=A0A9Q0YPI8_HOLLE|nr:hypothetical protein HOLleu_36635 [Holothuria leucospilota]
MHEVLESLSSKSTDATHIFEEIFRYGTLGQEWLPKAEARDTIHPVNNPRSIIAQTLSTQNSRTSLPTVGRLHKKSQCTLCNFDPSLIPSLVKATGYEIPLQVRGQCYHIQAKDQRNLNPKPDKSYPSKSNSDQDFPNVAVTNHDFTPVRQTCTWKDSTLSRMVSCEDYDITHNDIIEEQQHQMAMQINGHGFEDCNYLSNWDFDAEDKSFIQAVTLRNKAWHADTNAEATYDTEKESGGKETSSSEGSVHVLTTELKRKRYRKYGNVPAVLQDLCKTAVRSSLKNTVVGKQAKVSQLRFPPIHLESVKPVQRLKEAGGMKRNETKTGKFSFLRPKLCQNDGEFRKSLINELPLQLHSKSQVCSAKLISPASLSARIDTKLSLDSSISKKRLELPFRLPQLRVLPSIGSASIPQLGKSTVRRFKGEVSGHTVMHYLKR